MLRRSPTTQYPGREVRLHHSAGPGYIQHGLLQRGAQSTSLGLGSGEALLRATYGQPTGNRWSTACAWEAIEKYWTNPRISTLKLSLVILGYAVWEKTSWSNQFSSWLTPLRVQLKQPVTSSNPQLRAATKLAIAAAASQAASRYQAKVGVSHEKTITWVLVSAKFQRTCWSACVNYGHLVSSWQRHPNIQVWHVRN